MWVDNWKESLQQVKDNKILQFPNPKIEIKKTHKPQLV
ncbi:hypothetical protein [uncultured Gammaproteobacteria bacterium]|nr:hypothetical protein [uncultured Gammaproteobacteria bacterium]CAC9509383.1 hypothetical protein [uncultured Gammaproteobacteria bacterium]CAC9544837.1 hypothetical protein [uncultured Gammaproteobacteria bacterium]CAC9546980.1 hypothetical protein [uncultured Gammaproteobacteria bacterium]